MPSSRMWQCLMMLKGNCITQMLTTPPNWMTLCQINSNMKRAMVILLLTIVVVDSSYVETLWCVTEYICSKLYTHHHKTWNHSCTQQWQIQSMCSHACTCISFGNLLFVYYSMFNCTYMEWYHFLLLLLIHCNALAFNLI